MTISFFACAYDGALASSVPIARVSAISTARSRFMSLSSLAYSVREGPHTEVTADVAPQPVQALRLQHQEHDDEGAEHGETQRGNQVVHGCIGEQHAAERLHGVANEDGQQRDERRAKDR